MYYCLIIHNRPLQGRKMVLVHRLDFHFDNNGQLHDSWAKHIFFSRPSHPKGLESEKKRDVLKWNRKDFATYGGRAGLSFFSLFLLRVCGPPLDLWSACIGNETLGEGSSQAAHLLSFSLTAKIYKAVNGGWLRCVPGCSGTISGVSSASIHFNSILVCHRLPFAFLLNFIFLHCVDL